MPNVAELFPMVTGTRYFGPAKVLETDESDRLVRVSSEGLPGKHETWARVAIPFEERLIVGDEALVAGEDIEKLYVIGLLTKKGPSASPYQRLTLADGTCAAIDGASESPRLRVFSKRNELLFEYNSDTENARVIVESGDLEFTTRNGDIRFNSARNIRLDGQRIEMAGHTGVRLAVEDGVGLLRSAVSLGSRKMKLSSSELGITAQRGTFQVEETRYTGKRFLGKIAYAQLIVGKLETLAKSIVEKAKNVYRTVEQLSQLKTGRMRTLIESTYHMKAKKAFLRSEEDFKVKADKIHLG